LNRIYLSGGVYGVETMSQNLYGKPASKLTLPEASLDRRTHPRAVRAVAVVEPRRRARSQPCGPQRDAGGRVHHGGAGTGGRGDPAAHPAVSRAAEARFGYAKEFLRQQFRDRFGGDHPPDWTVRTTFLPDLQEAAERAVENGLRHFANDDLQAALVAIDPATGDVLALVGGRNFRESQFNRAWRSRRQPGSAFKPFLYAAALAKGYSPVSVLDGLTSIAPQGPEEWAPRNAKDEVAER
jgi:penicillin-binding protein 1A